MTRNEITAQMRAEFTSARATYRAEFLATATPFEKKLDAILAAAEKAIAKALAWLIGPEPVKAAEDALSS